ncbi:MAG TPA: cytochrome c, partial [Pseudacidobacterium sp.]|nr:cytochrome c [Pseudacidobacterium sp.]
VSLEVYYSRRLHLTSLEAAVLKPLLVSSALLLVALFSAAQDQPSSSQQPSSSESIPQTNPVKPTPQSQARAKQIYGYDCAMCHGDKGDGKGDVANDMKLTLRDYTKPDALKDLTDAQMYDIIKNGKGQMPGEGPRAKPDEIWNLIIYLRSMSKKTA